MKDSLKQYLDLYSENRELIDRNSSNPINALRQQAADALEANGLPAPGSENYEITDLDELLAPDYGVNVARVPLDVNPAASFKCGVPHLSTSLFLLVNDSWAESEHARDLLPEGVEIGSLRDWTAKSETADRAYGSLASLSDPITALDSLLVQDGMYLRVKKGVRLSRPLQLVSILNAPMQMMSVRRLLIIIEEDAEAQLLVCDHTQNPDVRLMTLQTVEISVGRNARFDFYDLEESSLLTTRLSSLWLRQEEGSNVLIDGMTLFNGTTRNQYHCTFTGEHASLQLLGMGIEDADRRLDTYSYVDHTVGHCHTQELFKYVVDGHATGAFAGRIHVAPGAVKTEAYQSNRNMVGSADARMYSKPQLEIYNDDVKCSHGTTVGQLDPMQVFYMRTRGLSEDEARLLLKQAFMADVIDAVRLPVLKDRIQHLTERRFSGEAASCADCGLC